MEAYYVNRQAQYNGDHEVHKSTCSYMPSSSNALYLGMFSNCHDAVKEAKKHYAKSNGCKFCCLPCHTT